MTEMSEEERERRKKALQEQIDAQNTYLSPDEQIEKLAKELEQLPEGHKWVRDKED